LSRTSRMICISRLRQRVRPPAFSAAKTYTEYQIYDQRADPNELVNLAGRKEYRIKADELRDQLKNLLIAAGEPEPEIVPAKLYP